MRRYGDLNVGRSGWGEDCRVGVSGVCRWRAKHAAAAWVQEAMVVARLERFAERGDGCSRRHDLDKYRLESSVDKFDVGHDEIDALGGPRMC